MKKKNTFLRPLSVYFRQYEILLKTFKNLNLLGLPKYIKLCVNGPCGFQIFAMHGGSKEFWNYTVLK